LFCGFCRITIFFVEQYPLDTVNVHRFILSLNAFIHNLSFATPGFRIYPFVSAYLFDLQCEHIQEEVGQHRLLVNVMHVHIPPATGEVKKTTEKETEKKIYTSSKEHWPFPVSFTCRCCSLKPIFRQYPGLRFGQKAPESAPVLCALHCEPSA
jgi:hypothetical protein